MNEKKRGTVRLAALLALCALLAATAALAAEAGSEKDHLVTLSYLNETFLDQILDKVDEKIADRDRRLGVSSAAADTFSVVTLSSGQTLTGGVGCEMMLRIGSAACVAGSAPGLIDETTAGMLDNGGALAVNHLYMATVEGRGVRATANVTKLLVRGPYTIG